ncbi:MAG: phosphomethylpyrimidine synthase ThiC [Candidatus Omnitrophica bacterium]|nr:phosphomethylpyrimidine synthase ThiC [Candidatus Omnitrophota bacterium]
MTQLESARNNIITDEMRRVSKIEGMDTCTLRDRIASGEIVIPKNTLHKIENICGIGRGLKTKVNANLGASNNAPDMSKEMEKLKIAVEAGADTVMDLSVGKKINDMLNDTLKYSPVPVGTVPLYEVATNILANGDIGDMAWNDIEDVIIRQAEMGVDFFTIHAGVTKEIVEFLKKRERILDVVSRGGSFMVDWISKNGDENPLYTNFDRILEIAKRYDVTLSLGDGMRPGAIKDAGDEAQIQELIVLGRLSKRARDFGVQVMIEGPGHVPINQIKYNVEMEKSICQGAPFYVLGPLVTDIAPGYDHIVGAIGGAIAASYGADFLCYVTPSEHLRIPDGADIKEGVIASRIAAHAADIAKGIKGAQEKDVSLSSARKVRDWKRQFALAIDPEKPTAYRKASSPKSDDVCSMCNEFCPIKRVEESFKR